MQLNVHHKPTTIRKTPQAKLHTFFICVVKVVKANLSSKDEQVEEKRRRKRRTSLKVPLSFLLLCRGMEEEDEEGEEAGEI